MHWTLPVLSPGCRAIISVFNAGLAHEYVVNNNEAGVGTKSIQANWQNWKYPEVRATLYQSNSIYEVSDDQVRHIVQYFTGIPSQLWGLCLVKLRDFLRHRCTEIFFYGYCGIHLVCSCRIDTANFIVYIVHGVEDFIQQEVFTRVFCLTVLSQSSWIQNILH